MKNFSFFFFLLLSCITNAQKPTFNHIAIYVKDLQKSSNFYQNIIGLDTIANPFNDGKHVWFSIGENLSLHVIAGTPSVQIHDQDNHLCFSVASVDVFTKKLSGKGIDYENSRHQPNAVTIRPDGVKQIYFKDPDGHWIEINDARR